MRPTPMRPAREVQRRTHLEAGTLAVPLAITSLASPRTARAIVAVMKRWGALWLLGLTLCSCGGPSVESTLPRVIGTHVNSLRSSSGLDVPTQMTRGYVWNRVHQAIAARCGVQTADPTAGVLVSHYCYSEGGAGGSFGTPAEATQTRSVIRVLVPSHATSVDALTFEVTSERRTRAPGGEPSEWQPFQPDTNLEASVRSAVYGSAVGAESHAPATDGLQATPTRGPRDVVFEESPQVANLRLQGALMPYAVSNPVEDRLETDWRTTRETVGRGSVLVRSRIRILFRGVASGTSVVVVAQLQYFVIPAPEDGQAPIEPTEDGWVDLEAGRVVQHAYAAISDSLRPAPILLEDEQEQVATSPTPPEPTLADPAERWAQGELPPGVYAYDAAAGTGEALYLAAPTDPDQVLGIVLDEQLRLTGGRVVGLGASVADPGGQSTASWHRLQTDAEWSAGVSFFRLASVGARGSSTETLAVFSSMQETSRVRIGSHVRYDGLATNARYFIESVGVGRAVDVAIVLRGQNQGLDLTGSYEGITATFGSQSGVSSQDCHIRARGMAIGGGLDCSRANSRQLMSEVSQFPSMPPVPVRFYLRRIPDELIGSAISVLATVDAIQFDASRADEGMGDRPEIEGAIVTQGGGQLGLSCQGSWRQQTCMPLQRVEMRGNPYAFSLALFDRDQLSANDEIWRGTYDLTRVLQGSTAGQRRQDVGIAAQRYTETYNGIQVSGWYRVW